MMTAFGDWNIKQVIQLEPEDQVATPTFYWQKNEIKLTFIIYGGIKR